MEHGKATALYFYIQNWYYFLLLSTSSQAIKYFRIAVQSLVFFHLVAGQLT